MRIALKEKLNLRCVPMEKKVVHTIYKNRVTLSLHFSKLDHPDFLIKKKCVLALKN